MQPVVHSVAKMLPYWCLTQGSKATLWHLKVQPCDSHMSQQMLLVSNGARTLIIYLCKV